MRENKYETLKKKHQEELNKFPIGFAFNDKQFKEAMENLGLKEIDTDKIVPIGAGGFIRKSDVKTFKEMNKRHREEEKQAILDDKTGEGYIKDMFEYELANHEYSYTYDLTDTLQTIGLSIEEILSKENLRNGLKLALNEYKENEEEEEI